MQLNDFHIIFSRTDSWSENGRLLKVGKVRLSIEPNPFLNASDYLQELHLNHGEIIVSAGDVVLVALVDANNPAVRLHVSSSTPVSLNITTEIWRTKIRKLSSKEKFSAFGICDDVYVYPDQIVTESPNVMWYHRNHLDNVWKVALEKQSLGYLQEKLQDPITNRTFGAVIVVWKHQTQI